MAQKYELIRGLYEQTLGQITATQSAWQGFLRSACRNYKCPFDEQVLIYAQRPDAAAVLEIERWNKQFGRWVNAGATGIAVFDKQADNRPRLKHYFDISDTHESRSARPVPVWEMRTEYHTEVVEALNADARICSKQYKAVKDLRVASGDEHIQAAAQAAIAQAAVEQPVAMTMEA